MALSNQATITLQVNVQNMSGVRNLTRALQSLKSQIMQIQRNPSMRSGTGAFLTPAQQVRQNNALQRANLAHQLQMQRLQNRINADQTRAANQNAAAQIAAANRVARAQIQSIRNQNQMRTAMAQTVRSALGLTRAEAALAKEMGKKNTASRRQKDELKGL
jgi:hypothetical protein